MPAPLPGKGSGVPCQLAGLNKGFTANIACHTHQPSIFDSSSPLEASPLRMYKTLLQRITDKSSAKTRERFAAGHGHVRKYLRISPSRPANLSSTYSSASSSCKFM